ncbi:hypothetical protein LJ737_04470 [Hymenobacter sp. 15J16-1T3B]|uniref:hypothetical protein n=1 Tax=Hymenobacter sp. 15J16-1T3B TaxID=2886941 RepID=UPI001D126B4F|nr:hypothetical protein [Hymenobacter sp. 15J16-1T3B]MCC3156478.1 hypothetical protein [Hymenobacter sp. 15J16-1T3B]
MPLVPSSRLFLTGAAVACLAISVSSCGGKDAPEYKFTAEQRAWADPYAKGSVWAFRNRRGAERRYQVTELKEKKRGYAGKSFEVQYWYHTVDATLWRQDSTSSSGSAGKYVITFAQTSEPSYGTPTEQTHCSLTWTREFYLPADLVNQQFPLPATFRLLPQATFGGRTYTDVLECTPYPEATRLAWRITKLYYTKGDGVVGFVEEGGDTWERQ